MPLIGSTISSIENGVRSIWSFVKSHWLIVLIVLLAAYGGFSLLYPWVKSGSTPSEQTKLASPDHPPIEYDYFDAPRAEAYLSQIEGGTTKTIENKRKVGHTTTVSLSGPNAQLGGSEQSEQDVASTVTPLVGDHFYTLLRGLRAQSEINYEAYLGKGSLSKYCERERGEKKKGEGEHWLGDIDDSLFVKEREIKELSCIGYGDFIRIRNAKLFLPSIVRVLPRLRDTPTFRPKGLTPHIAFDSPLQSRSLRRAVGRYIDALGSNPRVPIVAEPYAGSARKRQHVTFLLPALYRGLTREPSALEGRVTIVGVLLDTGTRSAYVDHSALLTFGRALLAAPRALDSDLGLCDVARASCARRSLIKLRRSVTIPRPFAVVLPVAIYE